jgi:hypothetical protein
MSHKGLCPDDPDCPLGAENVTLCIAAECRHLENLTVVHCCDSRQEKGGLFEELIGSDDAVKVRPVGTSRNFQALIAGIPTKAADIITDCRKTVEEYDASPAGEDADLEISRFLESLRNAAARRKRLIINHYLEMGIGLSFQQFLDAGREKFTPDHYNSLWSEIRNLDLGADVIFSGFHGDDAVVVRLDRGGHVHWEGNYSVIGVGGDIALVFLGQRDYDAFAINLMECLFRVVEAKKAAERNRHVGKETLILIAIQGKGRFKLTNAGWDALETSVKSGKTIAFNDAFIELGEPNPE